MGERVVGPGARERAGVRKLAARQSQRSNNTEKHLTPGGLDARPRLTASPAAKVEAEKRGLVSTAPAPNKDRCARCEMLLGELKEHCPAFAWPRPLKIGVHEDIAAFLPQYTPQQIGRACSPRWTGRDRYLAALACGGPRYDLAADPAGEVTPDQQQWAREKWLRRYRPKFDAALARLESPSSPGSSA
jgi:hypothetical protein